MKKKEMVNKTNEKKKNSHLKVLSTAMVLSMMLQDISMVTSQAVDTAVTQSVNPTQTITFANSLNQTQTKTITIADLVRVQSIRVNTGSASYTVNGENVTITVSGGTPTGQQYNAQKYSKTGSNSLQSSTNAFPATNPYSDAEGYSGTLNKSGSPVVVSGTYTPADTKTVTDSIRQTSSTFPSTKTYNSGGYSGTLYKTGSVTSERVETGGYWEEDGYWQETGYYQDTGYYQETGYYRDTGYYENVSGWWFENPCGALDTADQCIPTREWVPGGTRWVSTGSEWVSTGQKWVSTGSEWVSTGQKWVSTGSYWVPTYTTYYTQNYSGSVTKPESDTRVWKQNYSGTVYKSGYDNLYGYDVTVEYITDITPPTPATFTPNTSSPTNQNVSLTVNYPTDASVKQYKIGTTGTWTAYTAPLVLSSNNTIYARSMDDAGNVSDESSYAVTNIDKTAPVNATLSASTTSPTNQNVNVTISYPSDASVKEYKVGSTGTWTAYTAPVVLSDNNTVYARSKDSAGNLSAETSLAVNNIDKSAPTTPTLSADVTSPTNGNVVVSATFPADATVKEYSLNDGAWTAYSTAITFTSNGKLEVRAKDSAGNYSAIGTLNVTNIDKTAPVNATFVADKTSPTNQNVNVTINYPADATVKQYKIGTSGTWTNYTAPVALSANNTVFARSYDAVGNLSSESSYAVTNIDKVAPTTPTLSADATNPTNGNVSLSATFPADASVKEVRVNGGSWSVYSSPVVMTANGKVEVRATDNAGNVSAIGSYEVTNIDKTAPANATLSPSTTAPTNGDVSVTISYPSDASVKQYKIGSTGTWTSYTAPVVVSSNNTVYARSLDAVGNLSNESSLVISNIDKVAPTTPTVSADLTAPTNGNVVLNASFPADASVKEYRLNGGTWTAYSAPVTMTANGTFEARAKDVAGNYSAIGSHSVSNIDKTAPANATFVADKTSPTNSNVTVTINYPADASLKQYKIGSTGTWTSYTVPVSVSNNETVFARSYDAVGNLSAESNYVVSNIDKVAPTTPTVVADLTTPTNGNVVLTASFPADASVEEYRVNEGAWTAYTAPVTLTDNGKLEVRAKDIAGNYSSVGSYSVTNIDRVAPGTPTMTADKTAPTNTNVVVTASFPADASLKEYRLNGGAWTAYTAPVTMTANGMFEARGKDQAGNYSAIGSYSVTNIDKVAPEKPVLSADKTAPTNTDVKVSVSFSTDSVTKEVRVNGGAWTAYTTPVNMTANGKVEARSVDNAGNVSAIETYQVTNIDKVKPVNSTFTADKTAPTNKDVTVSIGFPADVVKKEVRVNGGSWTVYTTPVVFKANGKVEARGTDNAGNVSDVASYQVTNIDLVAPNAPKQTVVENENKISFSGDADSKALYRLNDGVWKECTGTVVTEDGSYKVDFKAVDPASNESSVVTVDVVMYRDSLNTAKTAVVNAETVQDQESVNNGNEKVEALPAIATEKPGLKERLQDVQEIIDARTAIEKALASRNEEDVQNAQEKIDLLDSSNPVIIDILDDIQTDFEEADILALVAKERNDVLSSKYGMSKEAYNALVNIYYAIKYTGDFLYGYAEDKIELVPSTDKHYSFVQVQFAELGKDYEQFVDDRVQTDAEIRAESSVKVMESNYDPSLAVNTQTLIDAVEDETIRASLQARLDKAKADYETGQLVKEDQEAITAVEKAESRKQTYYVSEAHKKVNALTNEALKAELTNRLEALEAQLALDKQVADATRTVELAEQYKYQSYIDSAQNKINALPTGDAKTSLQNRLDVVKAGLPTSDQATIIKQATNYVSLAQSLKTQYYLDKAQGFVDQITDEAKKAELQAKLDAIEVK